jgi:O-methyltransferase
MMVRSWHAGSGVRLLDGLWPARLRRGPGSWYRRVASLNYLATRDRGAVLRFLTADLPGVGLRARVELLVRFIAVTNAVRGYHTLGEMLAVSREILARAGRPELVVVEAGCGKGASTAKLSLATRAAGGRLLAFDSFRGLPANQERHRNLDGRPVVFRAGAFKASLPAVRRTLAAHGAPQVCELHKGSFADTLPRVGRPIDVALLDVDLIASTRTCLIELFPRLRPDGVLFSQDGHLRATHALVGDARFWRDEVGVEPPLVEGIGRAKLLVLRPRRRPAPRTEPGSGGIR